MTMGEVGGEYTAVDSVNLVNITLNLPYIPCLYSFIDNKMKLETIYTLSQETRSCGQIETQFEYSHKS